MAAAAAGGSGGGGADATNWQEKCKAEGLHIISRQDGAPVDWRAHYESYQKSAGIQSDLVKAVRNAENVFITGPGGTGKTVLIKWLHQKFVADGTDVHVVATTGMAATLINGTTIHRWAGVGHATDTTEDLIAFVSRNRNVARRWRRTQVLIVDEVSMLDPNLFEKLDAIGKALRNNHSALFGGIQLIMSGDFMQLPPVKPEGQYRFVFQHPLWEDGISQTFVFEHVYRSTDPLFTEVLGRVRMGKPTDEDIMILNTRKHAHLTEADAMGIIPTRLASKRVEVDQFNRTKLSEIDEDERVFESTSQVSARKVRGSFTTGNRYALQTTRAENYAQKNCPVEPRMVYKKGAQVMLVINLDQLRGLVNGSRGVVTSTEHATGIEVRFLSGLKIIIEPHQWKHEDAKGDKGEPITLTYTQMPLALAWALTIHKAQGGTLDCAEMNLGAGVFEQGQSYTALSRVRSLDSLTLLALDPSRIAADPLVAAYYDYIRTHGTHKDFRATINRIPFPTEDEMKALVQRLPQIVEARQKMRAKFKAEEEARKAAQGFLEKRRRESEGGGAGAAATNMQEGQAITKKARE